MPSTIRMGHRRFWPLFTTVAVAALAACGESADNRVTLWIEPPGIFRFDDPAAPPLHLPSKGDRSVHLAEALKAELAASGDPTAMIVQAPFMGSRIQIDGEYSLVRRAACLAGVTRLDLRTGSPTDSRDEALPTDSAAPAVFTPPSCGIAPVLVRGSRESPRRVFDPGPPD